VKEFYASTKEKKKGNLRHIETTVKGITIELDRRRLVMILGISNDGP
jgi:hypothetical protein